MLSGSPRGPMSLEFARSNLFSVSCSWRNPLAGWHLEVAVPLGVFSTVGSEQAKHSLFLFLFSARAIVKQFLYLKIL